MPKIIVNMLGFPRHHESPLVFRIPQMRIVFFAALALCSLAMAATSQGSAEPALRGIIEEGARAYLEWPERKGDRDELLKLYSKSGFHLLWSDATKPSRQALDMLQELRNAGERGLDPNDYEGNRLTYLLVDLIETPAAGLEQWALFDAGMSQSILRFMSDLHFGRVDPAMLGHDLEVARDSIDMPAAIEHLASTDNVAVDVNAAEPQFKHFELLKKELAHYRWLAADQTLAVLPPLPSGSAKPGANYSGAKQLLELLRAFGDLPALDPASDASAEAPNADIVAGLKQFQHRHGIAPDGVLGRHTYDELTRPLAVRVRQIELTMERWRWIPPKLSSPSIVVNIPQFRLFAFETAEDSEAHMRQMDVIVGKAFESTRTPVFVADMTYVVLRPYWEVPYGIAVKEIVPAARMNPATIAKRGLEIVNGYGDRAEIFPNTPENVELLAAGSLRLRQRPGPDNALGLIKFMMPNHYNVYLHSTPSQGLFAESRRDFSHGCIRVGDPATLAQYVLRDRPEWSAEKIAAAMQGKANKGPTTITLKTPIRVFIVYGTAVATEAGKVLFFDDIYGHDARLEQALAARRNRG
jgi:L,D-transpeptidase YcbB